MDVTTGKAGLSFLSTLLDLLRKLIPGRQPTVTLSIPKRTIIVAPTPHERMTWWHMGHNVKSPEQKFMQIVGRFNVTNITEYPIILSATRMKRPRYMGTVAVQDSKSIYHGSYHIPPGGYTDMSIDFQISPPFIVEGESFVTDIAVLDQFGNEHWIRKVRFIYQ